jgi:predicted transcriptional regulator
MSRPVVVLSPHEELRVAADVMRRRRIKRIPIAQAGRLLGLISFSDISRIAREQAKILLLEVSWIKDLIEERPLRPRTPVDPEPAAAYNRQGG